MSLILLDKFSFNKVIIVMYILFYAQIYSHKYFFTYYKGYSVYADGLIEQWGKVSIGVISFDIEYTETAYSIAMNSFGISYTGGGSSFDAVEGRCMSCNLTSMTKKNCTFDYGQRDIGISYIVLWQTKGY